MKKTSKRVKGLKAFQKARQTASKRKKKKTSAYASKPSYGGGYA